MQLKRLTFLIALVHATGAWADDAAPAHGLEEVLVRGTRIELPQAVGAYSVDGAALARMRASSSDSAKMLQNVPGVHAYGAGGVSSLPSVHGLADDRLRIKVDGMDLIASCPNHMNPALSYLDPAQIGTLQVYAGIAPVSMGGDSIGATIVAETAVPLFAAPGQGALLTGEAGAFYRSNGDAKTANLAATWASSTVSLSYTGATSQADNYDAGDAFKTTRETGRPGHTLDLDEVGSSAWETRNHTLGVAVKNDRHLLQASFGYQDMPYQLYPNQRMDLLDNEQKRVNLRYLGQFDGVAVEARAYRETVDHFMDFGDDKRFWYGSNSGAGTPCSPVRFHGDPLGTCAGGMPMYTGSETVGALLRADLTLSPEDLLRVGAEYQSYELDDWWPASGGGMGPGTFWNIRDGERERKALFAEWESRFATAWTASLGVRYERVGTDAGDAQGYSTAVMAPGAQYADSTRFNALDHARNDDNWDLAALARHVASERLEIEFGYAHKVRSPNLYERYTWSTWAMAATMNNFVGDGNGYVGNPALDPEQADTLSAALDWHSADRSRQLRVTPFYTRVDDYIDAVARPGFLVDRFNVLDFANQEARLYGVDVYGRTPIARTGAGEVGLEVLLNYTDGENRDSGDDLYNIMPLNAKIMLTHRLGRWDNALELVVVDGKDEVSDVRNEIATGSYELVNLNLGYNWARVRVDFAVENVFDEFYSLPLGGAYIGQGTTMSMNGVPWGIAVPGMGRSFNAGVTLRF
ncbi:MAG: Vitamin B12 transporter BtuB [Pseudomonadales bacterium]|nr:Vitamin B12 transporter BtuB [Pseudomonadales bacterium]